MKFLLKTVLCIGLSVALYGSLRNTLFASAVGPVAYCTGAPNDNGTCNADGCHNSFSLDSGNAIFSITAPAVYTPGKTVKLTVSFSNSSGKRHGFEMTAVDANGNRVGTFKKIGSTTQVIPPNDSRGLEQVDKGKYIEHTFKGIKKKSWKFKWKAPSDATDPITFYAAGCEANGDGVATDDYIYTATAETSSAP
ncbi:MAG: choice-of-anchor V domain-containing protein [Candidatus Brocadia sp.]